MNDEISMISVEDLVPSPMNPRGRSDNTKLRELAQSIKERGVLQPLLVRPMPRSQVLSNADTEGKYQIVAGERRWKAAQIAELEAVPVIIRELFDDQAMEIQMIENLQREDLKPWEEAEGYFSILLRPGITAETLAAKIGKSKSYIYATMKLRELPEAAMEALKDGRISKSTAQLIARIPNPKLAREATEEILNGPAWENDGVPMSYRQAKALINDEYMRELKRAPFSLKDTNLFPPAGACETCPKMTGNDRETFPDGRADVCTDPPCYDRKVEAWKGAKIDDLKKKGETVLPEREAEKIYPYGTVKCSDKYIELAEHAWSDQKGRTYQKLIGEKVKDKTVVCLDKLGQVHRLVPKRTAVEALREIGISGLVSDASKLEQAQERRVERLVTERVAEKIVERVGAIPSLTDMGFCQFVAGVLIGLEWSDVATAVARRRKLESSSGRAARQALAEHAASQDCHGHALLAEILWTSVRIKGYRELQSKVADFFGQDLKGIEKEVRAELQEKRKAKQKAPARKAKKAVA